jgi:hypothetical protein
MVCLLEYVTQCIFPHKEPETKRASGQQTHSSPVSSFGIRPGQGSFAPMTNNFSEHSDVQRRKAWVEGHGMTEIFSHELANYAGYRCICGKEVSKDSFGSETKDTNPLASGKMFMGCKGIWFFLIRTDLVYR